MAAIFLRMKFTKTSIFLFLSLLLASSAIVPAVGYLSTSGSVTASTPDSGNLQFVPLIVVAPIEPTGGASLPTSCTNPDTHLKLSSFIHCYTPTDIFAAYGVDALHAEGTTGKGQTIVIVDAYGSPTALSDLQHFSTTFGLPAPDLTIVHPTGTPAFNPAQHGIQVGWAFETSLDLQWAHAIAPDAKLVLVASNPAETLGVQGFPSMFIGEQFAITHYPGSVISQSFAATEQSFHSAADEQVAKFDQVYQQAVANHVTVIGSSGDTGTANSIGGQGTSPTELVPFPTVNWPSSDPLVTSAGGTWLQYGWKWNPTGTATDYFSCLNAGNPVNTCRATYLAFTTGAGRQAEAVWKEDWDAIATGGGKSVLFSRPNFQSSVSSVVGTQRGIPDVSWNSAVDGGVLVFTSFPGTRVGWHIVGGTSAASPQIAGLIALTNQLADDMGKSHVGYLNPLLYSLPASDFNDIVPLSFGSSPGQTLNSNAEFGTSIAGMSTTTGWDLTTGFGSPKAFNFVHDLASALP